MHGKSTKILLAAVLVFGAATSGLAQGTGTRPGTSPHPWTSLGGSNPGFAGQTGVPTRPFIPGTPGNAFDNDPTFGTSTRPLIRGTPGNAFGTNGDPAVGTRPDCLNGSITVAGC
jgi:hypothetical protein